MERRTRVIPYAGPTEGTLIVKHDDLQDSWNSGKYTVKDKNEYLHNILDGYQITDSESHSAWRDHKLGDPFKGDMGGPFRTQKRWAECRNPSAMSASYGYKSQPNNAFPQGRYIDSTTYIGPILPAGPLRYSWPSWSESDDSSLEALGTTAIASCSPSNPTVDLTVTFGEIFKEGLPSLIGGTLKTWKGLSNRKRRKAIGSEYLNYEFGWKPLINDLLGFAQGIVDADTIIRQYERDSGKLVRRGYDFPEFSSTGIQKIESFTSPFFSPSSSALLNYAELNQGEVYRTEEVHVRRWFRGAFTYYVPPPNTLRNDMARAVIRARKVLGISLTPDTLWNLAPWSWALDWFGNTGDILSNWTDWAIDNQVLMYGYMMEHSVHRHIYTFVGKTGIHRSSAPPDVIMTSEVKKRIQASPYGFGLTWNDFTSRQKAIIAALGLSRGR